MSTKYFDDEDRSSHKKHRPKHSRNIPGKGMKVINNYDIDGYDDEYLDDEYEFEEDIELDYE